MFVDVKNSAGGTLARLWRTASPGRGVHAIRETLSELESRLDPERFVRIHRSAIVGIDAVREVESLFHGDFAVVLRTGERLPVGRTYRDRFLVAIGDRRRSAE